MSNRKTMKRKTLRKRKGGKARIYYSSTEVRAVSNDGGKKWHIDADINGEKHHENLTSHDILDVLSYPASKKDLMTRLLEDFNMYRGDRVDSSREMQKVRRTRRVRKEINKKY